MAQLAGRQNGYKRASTIDVSSGLESSAVHFHDGATDRQTNAQPLGFGGEEGIEDSLNILQRESHPSVANLQSDSVIVGLARTNR